MGRSPRMHMWIWLLAMLGLAAVVGKTSPAFAVIITVSFLFMAVRRLNDLNRSPWWALMALVPLVNFLLLIVLLVRGSVDPD